MAAGSMAESLEQGWLSGEVSAATLAMLIIWFRAVPCSPLI